MTEQALAPPRRPSSAAASQGHYRWVVLAVGISAQASFTALAQGLPSVGPGLQTQWHLTLPQLGGLLTAASIGAAVTMLPWGLVTDRIGERTVLTIGLAAAGTATGFAAAASSYPVVLALLIVAGLAGGCTSAATGRAVMRYFASTERGLALGLRQTAPVLGAAAGAAALPSVVAACGVRTGLLALAAAMSVGAFMSAAGLRRTPPSPSGPRSAGRQVLTDRRMWRVVASASLAVTAQTTLAVYLVAYLVRDLGWDAGSAAGVLTVCQLASAVARVAAGRWSDRLRSRTVPIRRLTMITTVGLLALAASISGPTIAIYILGIAVFVTASSTYGLFVTAAAEIAGTDRAGTATGLINAAMYGAGAIAPIGIGATASAAGWQTGLLALAALSGGGWLLSRTLPASLHGDPRDTLSALHIAVPASPTSRP
ncbi:MFS transporter [Nocardia sp. NPDC052566]|uniref:MFS transporter n=1 Tax=Nocardia sp. NPDC052566 TaxID=3364330 RepID=UPI0037CA79FC